MAGRSSVVNQRMTFFRFQEFGNIRRADFQFQRRGHTVERLHPLARQVLTMLVQINKSGRNNEACGVNHATTAHCLGSYPHNLPVADADISHGIQSSLWIHHSPALDHEIELLRHRDCR